MSANHMRNGRRGSEQMGGKPTPWMVSFGLPWVHGGCSNPQDGGGEGVGEERHPGGSPGHLDHIELPQMTCPTQGYT